MAESYGTAECPPSNFRPEGPRLDPPARVGDYRLCEPLGRGGQAEVFRAVHVVRGTEAVVKIAREPASSRGESPLQTEARLLAGLEQPGLARVLDTGQHLGRPYLVLEYIGGPTLAAWRRDRTVTATEAARLVIRLARILAVAHSRGVIHRDLKPANVLLDPAGSPVVIDFGAALSRDREGAALLGTPAYMAPEQISGRRAPCGPHSDVFGLGGVLYFLLTGKPPFAGRSVRETFSRAAEGMFDREALARSGAPDEVSRICQKALAYDPADRFASAEELAGQLECSLTARPRWLAPVAGLRALARVVAGALSSRRPP